MLVGCVLVAGTPHRAAADTPEELGKRAAAESSCGAHLPSCDWMETLGTLDRQSVGRALADRHLEIDPSPWDKVIERVEVFNEPPFVEGGKLLRIGNLVHVTTQERAIRDELTITAGEVWDQPRVEESARRLHDPLYSSVIALVPVKSDQPGKVILLVVTRDIFSLRLNSSYTFQSGTLTNLNLSLSENNFLGTRNLLAAALTMDLGALAVGPVFEDKNLLGKHIDVAVRVDDILTRQAVPLVAPDGSRLLGPVPGDPTGVQDAGRFHSEGSDSTISISRPLWSLASEWGGGVSFSHSFSTVRQFVGTSNDSGVGLRPYDDPGTAEIEALPREYELHTYTAAASVVRQWGTDIKQQLSTGFNVTSVAPSLLPNFPSMDPSVQQSFIDNVLPVNEIDSAPFVEYFVFQPRFRTVRNINTYDLAEDIRLGFAVDMSIAQGLRALGGTFDFHAAERCSVAYTGEIGIDGFWGVSAGVSPRRQEAGPGAHGWVDNTASGSASIITPTVLHGRIVAAASVGTRWDDTQNRFLAIGSTTGLRAFGVNEFFGQRVVSAIVEARSSPFKVWVLRLGGVAFYEAGGSANSLATVFRDGIFQDAGVGLRMLIPQTSRELFRFDFAVPLNGETFGVHFIAGFGSYF